MRPQLVLERGDPSDCPECKSAGSVYHDFCEVCLAEFGETQAPDLVEPIDQAMVEDAAKEALQLIEVLDELEVLAFLGAQSGEITHLRVACRRLRPLVGMLRKRFLGDLDPSSGAA
jgi:hypothetical protein